MFEFLGSNLKNKFAGGTREREMRETRQAWDETQAYWRASPLVKQEAFDLSFAIIKKVIERTDRVPIAPIINAVGEAIEGLLGAENIGDLEAKWNVIESDVEAAIEFRTMLARRRRWSVDFKDVYGAFSDIAATAIETFFRSLPESCFTVADTEYGNAFEVPLIDLLDDPVETVDQLFMLPYANESFRLDIFNRLRELCANNLLTASGFRPDTNIREVEHKLIRPPAQKNKTGAELAQLYLSGSPLKALLDVPVPFYIPDSMRSEHCHIVGGTGHGKTQLMQKMIHADLVASQQDGRSVIVIDSQGDLINKLVRLELFSPEAPESLADRLVLIDPSDVEFPAALNLFDAHLERVKEYTGADRERVFNGVVELYELFFGAFLGAELTQKQGVIFKYLARLMLAIPDATIHTLMRIMEDGKPFKPYMDQLDGSARYFFETEFFHPSFAATKKQVLRRLWGILSTPAFERMFTQPKNKLDLFEAMNEGKIIFVSTAKDLLKREGSQLLGRFFIAMISQAALERSTLPDRLRTQTFVYVDEAQEYFDDSIETILNQARKYHVGITLAHQTLDQLSPHLRSAIFSNTSMKCAGGVSAKDARTLADELHTTSDFIEGMKRRGPRSEFAVYVKNLTGQAIRLSVPLGFLERQPTLDDDDYDAILGANRDRYCGTLADIAIHMPLLPDAAKTERQEAKPVIQAETPPGVPTPPPRPQSPPESHTGPNTPQAEPVDRLVEAPKERPEPPHPQDSELGKGGPKHRYLQSLVKELAEQYGLKATIEAPLAVGNGQVDVLIERNGAVAAVEISVSTPVEHELENLKKCLSSGYPRVAVVLVKSKTVQARYRQTLLENISEADRTRVSFLSPEELPDFIALLVPPPDVEERVVKGYRVKTSFGSTSAEDVRARRETVARLIARSLNTPKK